uniref:Uncharacterized protein n=1 Tax=Hyaloperonospora arabidopsidis (strain Emoy2) TaxID=559515 RepID=M4BBX4_HYAAE
MGMSRIAARQLRAVWTAPRGALGLRSTAGNSSVHPPVTVHANKNAAKLPTATAAGSSKRCCVATRPQLGSHMLLSRFQLHRLLALKQKKAAQMARKAAKIEAKKTATAATADVNLRLRNSLGYFYWVSDTLAWARPSTSITFSAFATLWSCHGQASSERFPMRRGD